jgi:hypothetical protein
MIVRNKFSGVCPKKWTNDPDDPIINPGIFFFEQFTVNDAMQHQPKPSF